MRSKASLDSSRDLHGGCGGGFVIRYFKLVVKSEKKIHAFLTKHGTRSRAKSRAAAAAALFAFGVVAATYMHA